jgi:hypothetical protein
VEPSREEIEGIMRRNGLEEKEALAGYHLRQARHLFEELYGADQGDAGAGFVADVYNEMHFGTHFDVLNNMLGLRVLFRDFPEGWRGERKPEGELPEH